MNTKKLLAMAGVTVAVLTISAPAFALGDLRDALKDAQGQKDDRTRVAAPEIDVTAGSKGIAVLIAGLLLAAEGLRRRRS